MHKPYVEVSVVIHYDQIRVKYNYISVIHIEKRNTFEVYRIALFKYLLENFGKSRLNRYQGYDGYNFRECS